jgi:hypothetical protein
MFAACSMLGACATVTRGTREHISIQSEPPGAAAITTTGYSCVSTPCRLYLPRKKSFDVTISKAGYQPQVVHVQSKISGGGMAGFAGNALIGGAVGAVIDASSGATDDLVPRDVKVRLQPQIADGPAYRAEVAEPPSPAPPPQGAPQLALAQTANRPSPPYVQPQAESAPPPDYGPARPSPRGYWTAPQSDVRPDTRYDHRYAEQDAHRSRYDPAPAYAPTQKLYASPAAECPPPDVDPRRPLRRGPQQGYAQPAGEYGRPASDGSDIIQ